MGLDMVRAATVACISILLDSFGLLLKQKQNTSHVHNNEISYTFKSIILVIFSLLVLAPWLNPTFKCLDFLIAIIFLVSFFRSKRVCSENIVSAVGLIHFSV